MDRPTWLETDFKNSPVHEYLRGLGRLTVDGPVGVSVAVADGYAEAAVVGADDADRLPGAGARDAHLLALAVVRRLYALSVLGLA